MELEKPVLCPDGAVVLASKLDADIHANACRIAFHGTVLKLLQAGCTAPLKIYKPKSRTGEVKRVVNETDVIVHKLFKKETALSLFFGLRVELSSGAVGVIDSSFGTSGQVRCVFRGGHGLDKDVKGSEVQVTMKFKKFIFDHTGRMMQ